MRRWRTGLYFLLIGVAFCAGYLWKWSGFTPIRIAGEVSRWLRPPGPNYSQWARRSGKTGLAANTPTELKRLASLGYLTGYEPRKSSTGVLAHEPELASPGYNLYASGHGPEVQLVDMEGETLHRWGYPLSGEDEEGDPLELPYFRQFHPYPNGDLVGIVVRGDHEEAFVVKLSRESEVLWQADVEAHHDLEVQDDGRIYVLTRREKAGPEAMLEDTITVLGPDGADEGETSILEAFANSRFASAVERTTMRADPLHTNALHVLDGSLADQSPAFRAGNILLSFRELHAIGVLEPEAGEIVWLQAGMWKMQHAPEVVSGGRMLIFDNYGHGGTSRVMEFDPFSQEVFWSYAGTKQRPLFTRVRGWAQRLENGNTLITETAAGRAIEVTPGHRVVWEFLNPHHAGEEDELIAAIPSLLRLSAAQIGALLSRTAGD